MVAPGCADRVILRLRAACAYSKEAGERVRPAHGNFPPPRRPCGSLDGAGLVRGPALPLVT